MACVAGDACVCGGDLPAVRATCSNWIAPETPPARMSVSGFGKFELTDAGRRLVELARPSLDVEVPCAAMKPPADGETIRVALGHLAAFYVARDVVENQERGTWAARLEPKEAAR